MQVSRSVRHRCLRVLAKQVQKFGTIHVTQHRQRYRVGLSVVVDVSVHAIHHIEVWVCEQLFQGCVFDVRGDTTRHVGRVVGRWGERLHIL